MINRDIKYINRDFNSFRQSLIEFTKTYFPNTYTDFTPSSPGMMVIEQASYVGDVLSFYLDNQLQENFIQYAKQLIYINKSLLKFLEVKLFLIMTIL